MLIIVGRMLYLAILGGALVVTVRSAQRLDRWLGRFVSVVVPLFLLAAIGMGLYLSSFRHRSYMGPDEVGYQDDALRMLAAYRAGDHSFVSVYAGIYSPINAVVIALWGAPSLVPMRLLNVTFGIITIVLAYLTAAELFESRQAGRVAAMLVAISPSLILFSLTNEKERAIGFASVACMLFGIRLIQRWDWRALMALFASMVVLGELRHYWAALIGWVAIIAFPVAAHAPMRQRFKESAIVLVVVGAALGIVTRSFLGINMRNETARRYVPLEVVSSSADYSLQGQTTGKAVEVHGVEATSQLLANFGFVLFGRFQPRGAAGRVAALWLFPDWLLMVACLPFAGLGTWVLVRQQKLEVLLPAGFVLGMIAVLTYVHGDAWTTYRFRAIYSPVLLMLAGGGMAYIRHRAWTSAESPGRLAVRAE